MSRMGEGRQGAADERRPQVRRSGPRERTLDVERADTVGPQGQALILELRRIQRAFDQERDAAPPTSPAGPKPDITLGVIEGGGDRRAAAATTRKGMIRRAVENCMRRFGFGTAPPADRT